LVREIQVGEQFEGTVTRILKDRFKGNEIGAIVELIPGGADGMVHISELRWERVPTVSDIVKEGDKLKVLVKGIDKEKNKIELSAKALLPKPEGWVERPPRTGQPGRRGLREQYKHSRKKHP
jgi:polyribonucleotide nucleotidyltransferase